MEKQYYSDYTHQEGIIIEENILKELLTFLEEMDPEKAIFCLCNYKNATGKDFPFFAVFGQFCEPNKLEVETRCEEECQYFESFYDGKAHLYRILMDTCFISPHYNPLTCLQEINEEFYINKARISKQKMDYYEAEYIQAKKDLEKYKKLIKNKGGKRYV